jgi:hypothetical protein
MKYRKKPVVIDAYLYDGQAEKAFEWVRDLDRKDSTTYLEYVCFNGVPVPGKLYACTLEGRMEIPVGNYIVCGVRGELYSCEPNIFLETYDAVVERETPQQRAEKAYATIQQFQEINQKLKEMGIAPTTRPRPGYFDGE